MPGTLGGRGVLVTRPAHQAESLFARIEAAGGRGIPFPVIQIQAMGSESLRAQLAQPQDLLIFVSANAVACSLPLFPEGRLPRGPRLAAIGRATARALRAAGRSPDLIPKPPYDSESLLALDALQDLRGRRVLILRGEGGRALLGETLAARGAVVRYGSVYRRVPIEGNAEPLLQRWHRDIHLLTATSNEILIRLLERLGETGRPLALATPLAVFSPRTARLAERLGFQRVCAAERADDAGLVAALCHLVNAR